MNSTPRAEKIIRCREVQERCGISRSSLYEKLNPKSLRYDKEFPKPLKLGAKSVGWLESDVQTWINNRVQLSRTA